MASWHLEIQLFQHHRSLHFAVHQKWTTARLISGRERRKQTLFQTVERQEEARGNTSLRNSQQIQIQLDQDAQPHYQNRIRGKSPSTQTNFDFVNKDHPFSHTYLGALWTFPSSNTTLKAKINPLLTAALAISHNLGSLGRYSLGL